MTEIKLCECCGAAFSKPYSYSANQWMLKRFCSRSCFGANRKLVGGGGVEPRPPLERLAEKFIPEPNSGCWLWTGSLAPNGYGQIWVGSRRDGSGKLVAAHRLCYEIFVGPIPRDLNALHKCDVRCCVNPSHIFLGTQKENIADMVNKGRHVPRSRLTPAQVSNILLDTRPQKTIASAYGVTQSNISTIKAGRSWKRREQKIAPPPTPEKTIRLAELEAERIKARGNG